MSGAGRRHRVEVRPLPRWIPIHRFLGPGEWEIDDGERGLVVSCRLTTAQAADLAARLRGLGLAGHPLEVEVSPRLPRRAVRAARTVDARRRRQTTPGWSRPGVRLDEGARLGLTPEDLAVELGSRARGRSVVDACCGAGGNAIGFARAGCPVTAIEIDPGRLEMARHNARVYGVGDRIRFVLGDAVQLLPTLSGDHLVFIDPPWGMDWDRTHSTPAELPLLEPLVEAASGFAAVWAKVPSSCVPAPGWKARPYFGTAEGDHRRIKFLVLSRGGSSAN